MENQEKNRLKDWLDKIQQDSWQLELVVTAFSIFLTLGAIDALEAAGPRLQVQWAGLGNTAPLSQLAYGILLGCCFFFLINLILHVILRGLWISAIGLRSVSGDVDFDALGFSPRFDKLLRSKVGSFDKYVERLENLSSIVFAFTFLIVFMLFSVGMWFGLTMLVAYLGEYLPESVREITVIAVILVLFCAALLYFVDFLTLGFVKRINWLSKYYLPIYRFYSLLTLSALYRPIYYNLIDNKFGRKAAYLLVPYLFGVLFFATIQIDSHVWYPTMTGHLELENSSYDDQREEDRLVKKAAIQSKYVSNGFLELFIRYLPQDDDDELASRCQGFKPPISAGYSSDLVNLESDEYTKQLKGAAQPSLNCLSQLYEVHIGDSLFKTPSYRFFTQPKLGEKGLKATFDVQYLPRGEHHVLVKKWQGKYDSETETPTDSLVLDTFALIPFWKE
jgi:hypothetical protein